MPSTPRDITVSVSRPVAAQNVFRGRAYYRLRFEVQTATGMPSEVFVHQRRERNGQPHDEFTAIAGPLDLVELPTSPSPSFAYHRLPYADLLLPTITLAEECIQTVKDSLQLLINGLDNLDVVEEVNQLVITSETL